MRGYVLAFFVIWADGAAAQPFGYIVNHEASTVSVIDAATNALVGTPVPVGSHPASVAITPDQTRAYVTNRDGLSVSVIETSDNSVVAGVELPGRPEGIAITPDGTRAYVTLWEPANAVAVIDTNPASPTYNTAMFPPIPVGPNPLGIAISPKGTFAYVTNLYSNTVSVVDTDPTSLTYHTEINLLTVGDGPQGVAFLPNGKSAYVGNTVSADVSVINAETHVVVGPPIPTGSHPARLAVVITPFGTFVYVTNHVSNSVSVIAVATNSVVSTISVGSFPVGVGATIDGARVYVANNHDHNVSIIDTATNTVVGAPVPIGYTVHDLAVTNPARFLIFPLLNKTPWTAGINSILDHSMFNGEFCPDPESLAAVTAFTGEEGTESVKGTQDPKFKSCGFLYEFKDPTGIPFSVNGQYTGAASLAYDGHPGYDYRTKDQHDDGTLSSKTTPGFTPVLAAAGGYVVSVNKKAGTVKIKHPNGYVTRYLHLKNVYEKFESASEDSPIWVDSGERIGLSGKNGATNAAHLHFEVRQQNGDIPVDPYGWTGWQQKKADPYPYSRNVLLWK